MNKKLSEAQIAFALKRTEPGTTVAEVIRKMGIIEQTYCRMGTFLQGLFPKYVGRNSVVGPAEAQHAACGKGVFFSRPLTAPG